MTLPMQPAPRLSEAARPYVPLPLPEPGPDLDEAARAFSGQSLQARGSPLRERDLRERDLLGMAMASRHGLAALRDLRPEEFALPVNQNVARAILDLADAGRRPTAAAVTAELRRRPVFEGASLRNTQLPVELDPTVGPHADPRTTGLGAWQTMSLAPETRAPRLAREIRSLHRQDTLLDVAHTALEQYRRGLVFDQTGQLEADRLGEVTKELADRLVSLPKELHPEWGHDVDRSVATWESSPSGSRVPEGGRVATLEELGLPTPPNLSPAARRALRVPGRG